MGIAVVKCLEPGMTFSHLTVVSLGDIKGEGVRSLAFAIAAKFCHDTDQIEQYAYNLVDNLLCHLDNDKEHQIESEQIENAGGIS